MIYRLILLNVLLLTEGFVICRLVSRPEAQRLVSAHATVPATSILGPLLPVYLCLQFQKAGLFVSFIFSLDNSYYSSRFPCSVI
jgi:hypothetical protein